MERRDCFGFQVSFSVIQQNINNLNTGQNINSQKYVITNQICTFLKNFYQSF